MRVLFAHKKPITCVAFSPDGTRLAEAAHGGTVRVWDVATGEVTQTFDLSRGLFPNQVKLAFGPDGNRLVASNDRVVVIDLATCEQTRLPGPASAFNGLHVSPDGRELIADGDKCLRWNLANHAKLPAYDLPPARGTKTYTWPSAAFSRDGARVAVSRRAWAQGNTNTAFVIDRPTGKVVVAFDSAGNDTRRLAFSPNGTLLAAASGPVLRVYDIAAGAELATLKVGKLHFLGMDFSPDGRWLATVSKDHLTRLWKVGAWGEPKTLGWDVGKLLDMAFSPDGATAAVASASGKIVLFDMD